MILLKNHIHQKEIEGKEDGLKYHNTTTHIYNLYNTTETTKNTQSPPRKSATLSGRISRWGDIPRGPQIGRGEETPL